MVHLSASCARVEMEALVVAATAALHSTQVQVHTLGQLLACLHHGDHPIAPDDLQSRRESLIAVCLPWLFEVLEVHGGQPEVATLGVALLRHLCDAATGSGPVATVPLALGGTRCLLGILGNLDLQPVIDDVMLCLQQLCVSGNAEMSVMLGQLPSILEALLVGTYGHLQGHLPVPVVACLLLLCTLSEAPANRVRKTSPTCAIRPL